jgi:hypothetical protein
LYFFKKREDGRFLYLCSGLIVTQPYRIRTASVRGGSGKFGKADFERAKDIEELRPLAVKQIVYAMRGGLKEKRGADEIVG